MNTEQKMQDLIKFLIDNYSFQNSEDKFYYLFENKVQMKNGKKQYKGVRYEMSGNEQKSEKPTLYYLYTLDDLVYMMLDGALLKFKFIDIETKSVVFEHVVYGEITFRKF